MLRKLFNFAAAVSLVFCLLAAGMWVRSEFSLDSVNSESGTRVLLASGNGEFVLYFRTNTNPYAFPRQWTARFWGFKESAGKLTDTMTPSEAYGPVWGWRPDDWESYVLVGRVNPAPPIYIGAILLPSWVITAFTGILPGIWLILRLYRRRTVGLCPQCGYDLRTTPDRCPECGKEVAAKPAAT